MTNPQNQAIQSFDVFLTKHAHKEFLALPVSLQAATADVINELKLYGNTLTEPEVKSFKNGLKELRAKSREGISRSFFFFIKGKQAYIVHIFQKKSQKTPKQNLDLAIERMKKLKQELENDKRS
ncbi:type II toxin-antitoxin system RelE/ParE family toxin [Mannheimia bovis]|uniref:type II toxin-antitoxin system RelE/ParE family toxin n=1 Tax=Mannheimia TaxID=75984 RepID=UPI00046C9943|nr:MULTISPECIES: type II toxin-antitoxin system RelE/ParE family toxin [Mannheimia]WHP47992.1 type II toxin-antitoxin system RelE/ParE family toxin [Mannheimia bovis]